MKNLAVTVILALAFGTAGSESKPLVPLTDFDRRSVICGCELNESITGAAEGSYGSGPLILLMAPNAKLPYALVNRGAGNIRLAPKQPIAFPMFQCEAGERFISEWIARTLVVRATLDVVAPGEEACWFTGVVAVQTGLDQDEIPVKGACGC